MTRVCRSVAFAVLLIFKGNNAVFADESGAGNCDSALVDSALKARQKRQEFWSENARKFFDPAHPDPFAETDLDADSIGRIHRRLRDEFPAYQRFLTLTSPNRRVDPYSDEERQATRALLENLRSQVASIAEPLTIVRRHAILELVRMASVLESSFPLTPEELDELRKREKEASEKKQKKSEQEIEESEDDDPFQKPPDRYSPANKDLSDQKKRKPFVAARTSALTKEGLFRQGLFDVVTAEEGIGSPALRPVYRTRVETAGQLGKTMIIKTKGRASPLSIPTVYGFVPASVTAQQPYRVIETSGGIFELHPTSGVFPDEVSIALVPAGSENMTSSMRDAYLQKSGISKEDWPDFLKLKLAQLAVVSQAQIVAELEKFISKTGPFLYFSVGDKISETELAELREREERLKARYPKAAALAHLGAFNCDGAALIGAILLRDFFSIPTRLASGFSKAGRRKFGEEEMDWLNGNGIGHMWVEAYVDGKWIALDFTPTHNLPRGAEDEIGDRDLDRTEVAAVSKADDSKDGEAAEGQEADVDERANEKESPPFSENDEGGLSDGRSELLEDILRKSDSGSDDFFVAALRAGLLEAGIELALAKGARDPEFRRTYESLGEKADSAYTGLALTIQKIGSKFRSLLAAKEGAISALPLGRRIQAIDGLVASGRFTEAYPEVRALIELFSDLAKIRRLNEDEVRLLDRLRHFDSTLFNFNATAAKEYVAVRTFLNGLSSVSKSIILSRYPQAATPGSVGQRRLAKDLSRGRLAPWARASIMSDLAELVTDPERIPNYVFENLLTRRAVPRRLKDVVVANSVQDFPHFILQPRPGQHLFAPLVRGEQFMILERDTRKIRGPGLPLERKRIMICKDVSSSMDGNPSLIADALVMNIVDRYLSETDAFGNVVNEVYIYPCDSEVRTKKGRVVKDRASAAALLNEYASLPPNASGATNIEAWITTFYELSAAAWARTDVKSKAFRHLSFVIITDGESEIDQGKIAQARSQLPQDIFVNFNLIGIKNSNSALVEIARQSSPGANRVLTKNVSGSEIARIVSKSIKYVANDDAFLIDSSPVADVTKVLAPIVNEISEAAGALRYSISGNGKLDKLRAAMRVQARASETPIEQIDPRLQEALQALYMAKLELEKFSPPLAVRARIAEKIVLGYLENWRREIGGLFQIEYELLVGILDWAGDEEV